MPPVEYTKRTKVGKTDCADGAARTILGEAYGYDAENLGDDDGENGW